MNRFAAWYERVWHNPRTKARNARNHYSPKQDKPCVKAARKAQP